MRKWLFVLSITVVLTVVVQGAAQASSTSLALLAGPSSYDLSGVGTGFAAAAQFSWSPLQILVLQPSVTAFSYRSQVETRITYLFTECGARHAGSGRHGRLHGGHVQRAPVPRVRLARPRRQPRRHPAHLSRRASMIPAHPKQP
jgi:hypothetical protein